MAQYDPNEIHGFLSQTPEKGLRQIMVDPKNFTEVHFNMLMKILRTSSKEAFIECFEKNEFPKIKFSANEIKLKENFWTVCCTALANKGIISPIVKAA